MSKKILIDNPNGLGLVMAFHQAMLDEQATFVTKLEQRKFSDLAPRTKQEEADMAWDEGLFEGAQQ